MRTAQGIDQNRGPAWIAAVEAPLTALNPPPNSNLPRRQLLVGACAAALGVPRPTLAQETGVSDNLVTFGHTGILSGPLGAPVSGSRPPTESEP